MAYTSTVPAVLDALVQRWTLAAPDALVVDGQPVHDYDTPDLVLVGFTGTPGAVSVTGTLDREQMAVEPDREQYEITCMVSAWKGAEDDVKAVRDRAYEIVDAIAADLAQDSQLGGLVMSARLSTSNLAQYYTDGGVSADVQVVVSVDAFTRRS
jgi:hypothetical protein